MDSLDTTLSLSTLSLSSISSILGFISLYSILGILYVNLISSRRDDIQEDMQEDIKGIKLEEITFSILESKTLTEEEKQNIFDTLLPSNSLDMAYILYYIFKIKGYIFVYDENNNIKNYFDSFLDFKKYESFYGPENFHFNLSYVQDTALTFGDQIYNLNAAHLKFISWLYARGIYDYLICDESNMMKYDMKYEILNEMNDEKLLTGNLFLRYQFFLIEYENHKINQKYISLGSEIYTPSISDVEDEEDEEEEKQEEGDEEDEEDEDEDEDDQDKIETVHKSIDHDGSNYSKSYYNTITTTRRRIFNTLIDAL